MSARWILPTVGLALVLANASGSQAAGGSYICRSSTPVAASVPALGGFGPTCSFVVTCPPTVSTCTVSANAIVSGVGLAGVYVEIAGTSGKACSAPTSCQTANVVKTMTAGDEVSVVATWSTSGTVPASAAALGQILLQAQRANT